MLGTRVVPRVRVTTSEPEAGILSCQCYRVLYARYGIVGPASVVNSRNQSPQLAGGINVAYCHQLLESDNLVLPPLREM